MEESHPGRPSGLKFIPSEIVGRYDNGLALVDPKLPKGNEAPEVGWYAKSKSPDLIEAVVFLKQAHVESKRPITGKM